jgi:hypothetical protein
VLGDHHVLPQGGGAVFGQDEQALVGLDLSAQLQLALVHLGFDLTGDGQPPVGTVAHAQGFGLQVEHHVHLAQGRGVGHTCCGGQPDQLTLGLQFTALGACTAQAQLLQVHLLTVHTCAQLPLAELDALHS